MKRTSMRLLEMEMLESRDLPAGTVTVTQTGTALRLVGDSLANSVVVTATGPNSLSLRAENGTTIVGPTRVAAISRVYLDLRDGDDNVVIESRRPFQGSIVVSLGRGNDKLAIGFGRYHGSVLVIDEQGDNTIHLFGGQFYGDVVVNTGSGNDAVHAFASQFYRRWQLNTDGGNDIVSIAGCQATGPISGDLGAGNDELHIGLSSLRSSVRFDMGDGNDRVNLVFTGFAMEGEAAQFIGGPGFDIIEMTGVFGMVSTQGFEREIGSPFLPLSGPQNP
jgi:hypothetical protein